jgi:hypothetical protein
MQALLPTLPTLAVSAIYCLWYTCQRARLRQHRVLRERVAHMVWVVAAQME